MIKKFKALLFCTLFLLSLVNAQVFEPEWSKPVPFAFGSLFQAGERLATLTSSPWQENYYIRTFSPDGDSLERFLLPGNFYPRAACYDAASQAFFVAGTDPNNKFAMLVKILPDSTVAWTKSVAVPDYSLILGTAVDAQDDKALLGFFVAGQTNAVGYFLFDADGNLLYQSDLSVATTSLHEPAHRMKFDHAGNVVAVLTPTNFGSQIRMVKFDGLTGHVLWTKLNLALPLYGSTASSSDFVVDAENNIYFSGHCNRIIKLSPDGTILYKMPVDALNYKLVFSMELHGDYLLLMGAWKTIPNNIDLFSSGTYLAAVYAPTGAVQWERQGEVENSSFSSGIWASDTVLYIGSILKYILPQTVVKVSEPIKTLPLMAAWPNPSPSGEVWLDPKGLAGIVRLYNQSGQLVKETQIKGSPILLQLPTETGIYEAVLTTSNGQIESLPLMR